MASQPLPHFESSWPGIAKIAGHDSVKFSASGHPLGADIVEPSAEVDIPVATFDAIVRLTKELFAADVQVERSVDPECPERPDFVFHVHQKSRPRDVEEEIDRELDWHARIGGLAPEFQDRLRLMLW